MHRGDLDDLESLRIGAANSDGVIHTGFIHDFSKFKEVCETDRRAIEALGSALAGSNRPLIITSGIGILPPGGLATEETMPASGPISHPRAASEQAADSVAARGARVSVVRLPPSVHGDGDHGFVPTLITLHVKKAFQSTPATDSIAGPRCTGSMLPICSGLHLRRLLRRRARFHGVAEEGVAFREIAEVIGRRLNIPVVSKSPEEAAQHFGWFAHFAAMNNPASSQQTRELLGWQPKQPGLIADLDRPRYFET